MADTSTPTRLMPNGVMERLGKYGYAVSDTPTPQSVPLALCEKLTAKLVALPGVSKDPRTRGEITAILERVLNGDQEIL